MTLKKQHRIIILNVVDKSITPTPKNNFRIFRFNILKTCFGADDGLRRVLGTDPRKLPQQLTYTNVATHKKNICLINNGNYEKPYSVSLDVRQSKATTTTTTERTDGTTID